MKATDMRHSLLCSRAPLARSTTICFRGPLCPYLAADRCMVSHIFFQNSHYADNATAFPTACSAVSPHQYQSSTPETFTLQHVRNNEPPILDRCMFSPVLLQSSCHANSPNSFAATEVEPFFPSDCPAASPRQCLAEQETSAFQSEITNALPLQIQLYPERPRTPAISRPMYNEDTLLYSHIAANEINHVANSLLDHTPMVTRRSKVTDFFHTRAVCYTSELISLSVKVKSQKTQPQSWKYMSSPSKVQELQPHYERRPEVHHPNTIWSHLVDECFAEGDEAYKQDHAVESPKARCSRAQSNKSSNADKKDPFVELSILSESWASQFENELQKFTDHYLAAIRTLSHRFANNLRQLLTSPLASDYLQRLAITVHAHQRIDSKINKEWQCYCEKSNASFVPQRHTSFSLEQFLIQQSLICHDCAIHSKTRSGLLQPAWETNPSAPTNNLALSTCQSLHGPLAPPGALQVNGRTVVKEMQLHLAAVTDSEHESHTSSPTNPQDQRRHTPNCSLGSTQFSGSSTISPTYHPRNADSNGSELSVLTQPSTSLLHTHLRSRSAKYFKVEEHCPPLTKSHGATMSLYDCSDFIYSNSPVLTISNLCSLSMTKYKRSLLLSTLCVAQSL